MAKFFPGGAIHQLRMLEFGFQAAILRCKRPYCVLDNSTDILPFFSTYLMNEKRVMDVNFIVI